jgi:hypothetical protein
MDKIARLEAGLQAERLPDSLSAGLFPATALGSFFP